MTRRKERKARKNREEETKHEGKKKKKIKFFSKVFLCCGFLIFLLQNIEFF